MLCILTGEGRPVAASQPDRSSLNRSLNTGLDAQRPPSSVFGRDVQHPLKLPHISYSEKFHCQHANQGGYHQDRTQSHGLAVIQGTRAG